MAIDTAAKRTSAIGVALLFLRLGVIPDGSNLSAAQRLHTDGLYSGIAAGAPVADTGFWCALSGISGLSGGGDLEELD